MFSHLFIFVDKCIAGYKNLTN